MYDDRTIQMHVELATKTKIDSAQPVRSESSASTKGATNSLRLVYFFKNVRWLCVRRTFSNVCCIFGRRPHAQSSYDGLWPRSRRMWFSNVYHVCRINCHIQSTRLDSHPTQEWILHKTCHNLKNSALKCSYFVTNWQRILLCILKFSYKGYDQSLGGWLIF